ncbi:MAG: hypothetical protein ABIS45_09155 [Burkholderiales bacterium]
MRRLRPQPAIRACVHAEIAKFAAAPEVRSRFAARGVELKASATPAEFATSLKREYKRWAKVLDDAGIKPE